MLIVNGKKVKRSDYVTKNFKYGELASKDGATTMKLSTRAINLLQKLRDGLDAPIIISSAYRSPRHNKNVKGSSNSRHLEGDAFDIVVGGYTPLEIAHFARGLGFTGVSAYNTFTHVDTRPGRFVSWGANKNKIVAKPLPSRPKPQKPKPITFTFKPDILTFDIGKEVVETPGIRRYVSNNNNFIQFIAVRDLETLGFKVEWKNPNIILSKSGKKRKPNLNLGYIFDTVDNSMVNIQYNGKKLTIEGLAIYDKNNNPTQFIPVKSLKGLGLIVEWDSKRRLVVLR